MEYNFNEGDNITITSDFIDYLDDLKKQNQFLMRRDNKLQNIEQYVTLKIADYNENIKKIEDETIKNYLNGTYHAYYDVLERINK